MSKVYYMNVHSEVHENVTQNVLGSWDAILVKGEGGGQRFRISKGKQLIHN